VVRFYRTVRLWTSGPRRDCEQEITMHAIRWGLPRLAIVVGGALLAVILAYCVLVFAIVVVQAVASFGQ
jgi:hypothetical protein